MSTTKCDYCGNMLNEWDFMADCGHIICGSICYDKYKPKCPICKKQCRFVLIGEKYQKMPADGTGYLKPVRAIFNDAEAIISFRLLASSRLVHFLKSKISKQKELLHQAKQELSRVKEYKWEIYNLRKENEALQKELQRYMDH